MTTEILRIGITLPPGAPGEPASAEAAAAGAVTDLVEQLGLPVDSAAEVRATRGERLAVAVDGRPCRLRSQRHLYRVRASVDDVVVASLHDHADLLLTPEVTARLWEHLGGSAAAVPPWFPELLADLLRHRVRPGRLEGLLDGGRADPAVLFERAVAAAAGPHRIFADPEVDRTVQDDDRFVSEWLPFMASGLFVETGVPLATPRYEVDADLPAHHFAVALNDLRTPALPGLLRDQMLVNDTAERLQLMGVEAMEVMNPATSQPAAVAPLSAAEQLEAAGLTVWSPSGFVILVAAAVVRHNVAALYHSTLLSLQLEELEASYPLIPAMVERTGGIDRVTRILRRLLREQIPIDDLAQVLRSVYRAPETPLPAPNGLTKIAVATRPSRVPVVAAREIGNPHEASLAETARCALADRLTAKFARGTPTVVVYLLDPAIEQRMRDPTEFSDDERRALLIMVTTEIDLLPRTAQTPCILTRADIRARLRSLLAVEHPDVTVISYEELTPEINIQPVARLSLE
jgi:hypothetical protein